ncbi:MAG TPA: hypothetical protein DCP61_05470 [Treponema sp.]|nr:hypothetical protein [Treponema sp.]
MKFRNSCIRVVALGFSFLIASCISSCASNSANSSGGNVSVTNAELANSPGTSVSSASERSGSNASASSASASAASASADAHSTEVAVAEEKKPAEPKRTFPNPTPINVELPPSSGNNLFAGNTYSTRNLKVEFVDAKKLTASFYSSQDECWSKEFSASYSFNTAKSKLYVRIDSVYEDGEKLSSAKDLYHYLWPKVRKKCKKYLSATNFNSASKKSFNRYAMENLDNSSRARFEKLLTFTYRFLDKGNKLELTSSLEPELSEVAKGQLIGMDKSGRIQLAFSNLTVQILCLGDKSSSKEAKEASAQDTDSQKDSFYIGNCEFNSQENKVSARMFRIFQSKDKGKTVYESMQEAGLFEATYSVKTSVNTFAQKQHFSVYDGIYNFKVVSMPEASPALEKIEIPVYLHVDKYVLKKEHNSDSEK